MRISSQECMKFGMRATGALLGATGGAVVAVAISNRNFAICKAIANNITGTGGHVVVMALRCLFVEACAGASVGGVIGWKLADRLAQRILGERPHLA